MLRLGLTGGLGSGKSTVAAMLARHGAYIIEADEIGRMLMQPGQAVFAAIVNHFGPGVVSAGGELDRAELARLAFEEGLVEELNAIVHPAVIQRQEELMEAIGKRCPEGVTVVESALIFETRHGGDGGWRTRFDRVLLVTAGEEAKIARFVDRSRKGASRTQEETAGLQAEARRRLGRQIDDKTKADAADYIVTNNGSLAELQMQVDGLWPELAREAGKRFRGV